MLFTCVSTGWVQYTIRGLLLRAYDNKGETLTTLYLGKGEHKQPLRRRKKNPLQPRRLPRSPFLDCHATFPPPPRPPYRCVTSQKTAARQTIKPHWYWRKVVSVGTVTRLPELPWVSQLFLYRVARNFCGFYFLRFWGLFLRSAKISSRK